MSQYHSINKKTLKLNNLPPVPPLVFTPLKEARVTDPPVNVDHLQLFTGAPGVNLELSENSTPMQIFENIFTDKILD